MIFWRHKKNAAAAGTVHVISQVNVARIVFREVKFFKPLCGERSCVYSKSSTADHSAVRCAQLPDHFIRHALPCLIGDVQTSFAYRVCEGLPGGSGLRFCYACLAAGHHAFFLAAQEHRGKKSHGTVLQRFPSVIVVDRWPWGHRPDIIKLPVHRSHAAVAVPIPPQMLYTVPYGVCLKQLGRIQ